MRHDRLQRLRAQHPPSRPLVAQGTADDQVQRAFAEPLHRVVIKVQRRPVEACDEPRAPVEIGNRPARAHPAMAGADIVDAEMRGLHHGGRRWCRRWCRRWGRPGRNRNWSRSRRGCRRGRRLGRPLGRNGWRRLDRGRRQPRWLARRTYHRRRVGRWSGSLMRVGQGGGGQGSRGQGGRGRSGRSRSGSGGRSGSGCSGSGFGGSGGG